MRPGTFILCVLNAVFAIIAVAGNGVLIAAVLKTPSLQTPTNSLLCSLGVTDFLTGLISQPSFIVYNILRMERDTKLYCRAMLFTSSCGYLLSGVSLFCLTAISFERYLALKLHLRYKELVTNARVCMVVATFWIFCCLTVLLYLLNYWSVFSLMLPLIVGGNLFVTFSTYCFVLRVVNRHRLQIRNHDPLDSEGQHHSIFNMAKYKRSVSTSI